MKKLLIGSLLTGLALFVYGFVSFAVLKWHNPKPLKDDTVLAKAIAASVTEPGMYMVPSQLKADGTHRSDEEWMAASNDGPYMLAMIRPGPNKRPMISYLSAGLVLNVGLAFLFGFILRQANLSYGRTLRLGGTIGLFVALANWLPAANWYEYPASYWAPYLVDQVIQGTLAAAILGRFIVKPAATAS